MSVCPCRALEKQPKDLKDCCGPILAGKTAAPTAESLMRARYSAYAQKNMAFIDSSQIMLEGENFNQEDALKWAEGSEWQGMTVVATKKGTPADNTGIVEFQAHYKDKASGKELIHKETALFEKKDGNWKFKDGNIAGAQPIKRLEAKVGRNDPCSCGSGKKFKKCCAA